MHSRSRSTALTACLLVAPHVIMGPYEGAGTTRAQQEKLSVDTPAQDYSNPRFVPPPWV